MVKLNKIYTRTGDSGSTGLTNGNRVSKASARVEAYGSVDETNAAIGMARLHTQGEGDAMLERIQHDLFDLGADLSLPVSAGETDTLRIQSSQVARLEREIDAMNDTLSPLSSFVLPGGSPASAHLHLARAICRRAERQIFALKEQETVNPRALQYLNRLSDHLFVLARAENTKGEKDVLWEPGKHREG
jgi:cob(I)alamin adenosyltransferase